MSSVNYYIDVSDVSVEYQRQFLEAGIRIVEECKETKEWNSTENLNVQPAILLFRIYVESCLKALIIQCPFRKSNFCDLNHHQSSWLPLDQKNISDERNLANLLKYFQEDTTENWFDKKSTDVILKLHVVDPDGTHFSAPVTGGGMTALDSFDLDSLENDMLSLAKKFEELETYFLELRHGDRT